MAASSHEPSTVTQTDRPTVQTMELHLKYLQRALKYYNRPMDSDHLKSTTLWIQSDLAYEQELNRETKKKQAIHYDDVRQVIQSVWSFESLSVFRSIQDMFQMTLVLNLLIDGASRVGEFVPDGNADVADGKYIKWEDIDFWMFPDDATGSVAIFAVILCRWVKVQRSNEEKYKKFVVRMLKPHMIFEDSCRLLLSHWRSIVVSSAIFATGTSS